MAGGYQPQDFEVKIDSVDGTVTVSVTGELDIGTVGICLSWVESHNLNGATAVVIDLQALTFVDSAGIRALLIARDRLSQQGLRVEFVNLSKSVNRVLAIFGLDLNSDVDIRMKDSSG